jgi:hypothetical protein
MRLLNKPEMSKVRDFYPVSNSTADCKLGKDTKFRGPSSARISTFAGFSALQ